MTRSSGRRISGSSRLKRGGDWYVFCFRAICACLTEQKVLVDLHIGCLREYRMGRHHSIPRSPFPRAISQRTGRRVHHTPWLRLAACITGVKYTEPRRCFHRVSAASILDAWLEFYDRSVPNIGACGRWHAPSILVREWNYHGMVTFQPGVHVRTHRHGARALNVYCATTAVS